MKLEKKKRGDREYYYISKSVRIGDVVKNFTRYIGPSTIPTEDLERDIEFNKKELMEEIARYKAIQAPLADLLIDEQVENLEKIRSEYQKEAHRILSVPKMKLYESFGVKFTYNTNAIEGSTVTEQEAVLILKDHVAPGGKSMAEIKEAENHQRAFEFILEDKGAVTKKLVLEIHKMASEGLLGPYEGRFRDHRVSILGTDVKTTPPENIGSEMNGLLRWYGRARNRMHPFEAAVVFHEKFERIHPFRDYNGRVGRLLLNYMLHSEGFPMVIIPVTRRQEYYDTLDAAHKQNYKPWVKFVYDLMVEGNEG